MLALAIALALAFAFTNGFHDAANAIATLVATGGASPSQAIALTSIFNVLGAVLVGTAVADAVASVVNVSGDDAVAIVGAGLFGAVVWNLLTWWRGLPASSGHALIGGLVGAALATAGPDAVRWGGIESGEVVGALGILIVLALAPVVAVIAAMAIERAVRRLLRRARRRVEAPLRIAQIAMTAALSFGHGANDAQKSMGVIAVLLLASGHESTLEVPFWAKLACAAALTIGTAVGGWRIVRTIGRRIYRLRPLDAFFSQSSSSAVLLAASYAGAPVSTTHVVASSVVGVGGGKRRWRHVRWSVVKSIGLAWILTLPASAAIGAAAAVVWTAVA